MRPLILLPLLLAGCSGGWPSGSYVQSVSPADAKVLAPAIADYLASALPARQDVSLKTTGPNDPIAPLLIPALDGDGIAEQDTGQPVSYIAAGMDGGILLRISLGDQGASRYYIRTDKGDLIPGGPLMVARP